MGVILIEAYEGPIGPMCVVIDVNDAKKLLDELKRKLEKL